MSDPARIIIIILLILFSAMFSASESAFSFANKIRLKVKADDGNKKAALALKLLDKFDQSIITLLIYNNVVNILVSVLSTLLVVKWTQSDVYGSLIATVFTTVLVFVLGEVLPKNIAQQKADSFCMLIAYPIYFFSLVLKPISILYSGLVFLVKKLFRVKETPEFTEDDFTNVIESIEEQGLIEEEESDIIQSAVEFGSFTVREILTPKDEIVALDINELKDNNKALPIVLSKRYSRIPIYANTLDNIIGILHIRTYIKQVMLNKNYNIQKNLTKPYIVNPNMKIDDLFEGFRESKMHIAIVKEHNKTLGMVTMEDVLEQLVGDVGEEEQHITKGGDAKC